jgi:hypothetical protein
MSLPVELRAWLVPALNLSGNPVNQDLGTVSSRMESNSQRFTHRVGHLLVRGPFNRQLSANDVETLGNS